MDALMTQMKGIEPKHFTMICEMYKTEHREEQINVQKVTTEYLQKDKTSTEAQVKKERMLQEIVKKKQKKE